MKLQEVTEHSVTTERRPMGASPILLICEHASRAIPKGFDNLGLTASELESHVAWDPGALAVAERMSDVMDATLLSCVYSRLLYDCNRPPDRIDAIRDECDGIVIPGNRDLSISERQQRVQHFYQPFKDKVEKVARHKQVIVTIHSFNPVYERKRRDVEIGLLHDIDARLAKAMLLHAGKHTNHIIRLNDPYGPSDGVTHTLKTHALKAGKLNVMIEIRNDLIANKGSQIAMAKVLCGLIEDALQYLSAAQKGVNTA